WQLLQHSSDPRVRSHLVHRFAPLNADARAIIARLDEESDVSIQRALILSLGDFDEKQLSAPDRELVSGKLRSVYRTAVDPGLPAAVEWLLRHWNHNNWLWEINEEWARQRDQQNNLLAGIRKLLAKHEKIPPQWFINGQGQTMVVLPGPVEFVMGSPV